MLRPGPSKGAFGGLQGLKLGGALLFVEHVRPEGQMSGRLADAITPAWRRVAGGCHPNRRTGLMIAAAGLEIQEMTRQRVNGLPMIAGTALKPLAAPPNANAG